MKIVSLSLSNYRQFREPIILEMPSGLIGISGPNGVGKSKLIEAIGYALYANKKVLPNGDVLAGVRSFSAPEGSSVRVELQLEVAGQCYDVVRTGGKGTCLRLHGSRECLASGSKAVTSEVVKLLRLSPDAFLATSVAKQKDVAGLQTFNSADRQKVINRLIGVTAVEKGIIMVEAARSQKQMLWQSAERAAHGRLEVAEEFLKKSLVESECAEVHLSKRESEEATAKRSVELAQAQVDVLNTRLTRLSDDRRQLEHFEQDIDSREKWLLTARQIIAQGRTSVKELELAEQVLTQTQNSQEQRDRQEQLAEREALRGDINAADAELARLHGLVEQLEALEQAIANDQLVLRDLQDQRAKCSEQKARAEHESCEAQKEIDKHRERHERAWNLGESGECETCGQTFGSQLGETLDRYQEAEQAAQTRKTRADTRLHQARAQKDTILAQISRRESLLAQRRVQLSKFNSVSSALARCLEEVKNLEHRQSDLCMVLPPESFCGPVWEEASRGCDERREAERQAAILRPQVRQLDPYLSALQPQEEELKKRYAHKAQLEAQLTEVPALEADLADAKATLDQAHYYHDLAQQEARQAFSDKVAAASEVKSAQKALEEAQKAEASAIAAQRDLLVTERAETLLRRVRDEILAEARPRITYLLEDWASSLLSPYFRSIELTEDYRVRADLGSGPKFMEHFSGGEQTLLSVMLRVAIAIFCQERAGYDTGFLVLDEVFGDQDGVRRTQLVEFLQEIKTHFHQILIVNHIEAVTDMLDRIIEVVSIGDKISHASFR